MPMLLLFLPLPSLGCGGTQCYRPTVCATGLRVRESDYLGIILMNPHTEL